MYPIFSKIPNFGVKFNFNMENSNDEEVDMIDTIKSETKNVDLSQKIISLDDFRKNNDD